MPLFWFTAVTAFALSFAAKLLADGKLQKPVALIGDSVTLRLTHNPGIAFGVHLPEVWQEIFIGAALLLVCVFAWQSAVTRWSQIGFGLIVGGAIGNVVDRIPDGLVTDFVSVGRFPVFNVADSCITIGVLLLLAEVFGIGRSRT